MENEHKIKTSDFKNGESSSLFKEKGLNRKLTFVLLFAFLLAVIVPSYILFGNSYKKEPLALTSLEIGQTSDREVSSITGVKKKEQAGDGFKYILGTNSTLKNNEIVTKNGKVVFARMSIAVNDNSYGKIADYLKKFGNPDKIFMGSKYYGAVNTYVYAKEGFAIIGNPNTGTVYELQKFVATNIENYLKLYGNDIDENLKEGISE